MEELFPLIPEEKLTELIEEKMIELGVTQREIERKLDIPQSLLSRSLKSEKESERSIKREFGYNEVQRIIQYLLMSRSLIPPHLKAIDYATTEEELVYAYDNETISEVALKMRAGGYSQIPVKSRITGYWVGVVTDLGILKMLLPSTDAAVKDQAEIGTITIKDSEILEGLIDCSHTESLSIVAQMLVYSYAILLKNNLGEIKGIITRADILKLFENLTPRQK